jgi:hypothetical protein
VDLFAISKQFPKKLYNNSYGFWEKDGAVEAHQGAMDKRKVANKFIKMFRKFKLFKRVFS